MIPTMQLQNMATNYMDPFKNIDGHSYMSTSISINCFQTTKNIFELLLYRRVNRFLRTDLKPTFLVPFHLPSAFLLKLIKRALSREN